MTNTQLHQPYFNAKQLKLPLAMDILIPFDSEARTFDEVLGRVDLRKYLISRTDARGRTGYDPIKMLKLILFCQMEKIRSLREMAKAARNDIRVMWLTDELKPSHNTIKAFIDRHLRQTIGSIFTEISTHIADEEKADTSRLYIDGTKIEANANKYTFVWRGSVEKSKARLDAKVTRALERLNGRYQGQGIFFPVEQTYESGRLTRIKGYLEKEIDREGIKLVYGKGNHKSPLQRDYDDISEYLDKLERYEEALAVMGPGRNSYAKTDADATFMHMKEDHMRNGQLKAGYNVQIGVCDEYIMHLDVYRDRSDYATLIPFLEGYRKAHGGYPKYPVADAGYGGLKNYRFLKSNGMALYQKYPMYGKDTSDGRRMADPYRAENFKRDKEGGHVCPRGRKMNYLWTRRNGKDVHESSSCLRCPLTAQCKKGKGPRRIEVSEELWCYQKEARDNLRSELGIALRVQRSIQVEGAFGVLKEDFEFRRFRRRGIGNVKLEFTLLAIGYNLAKYHNKRFRIIQ